MDAPSLYPIHFDGGAGGDRVTLAQYVSYLLRYHKDVSRSFSRHRFRNFRGHVLGLAQLRDSDEGRSFTFQLAANDFADWTKEELEGLNNGYHENVAREIQGNVSGRRTNSNGPWHNRAHRSDRTADRRTEEDPGVDDELAEAFNWDGADNPLNHPVYATTTADGAICRIESPIINQGFCGSCWAFAASGAAAASVMINTGIGVRLSAQELLDCDTSYNRGCSGGSPALGLAHIMQSGASTALSYPYIGMVSLVDLCALVYPVPDSLYSYGCRCLSSHHRPGLAAVGVPRWRASVG